MQLRLRLSKFVFHVFYRAGIKQQVADALLRLSTVGEDRADLNNASPVLTIVLANKENGPKEINENFTY